MCCCACCYPNQANLLQTAIDSNVDGIAVTLAKPDAMAGGVQEGAPPRSATIARCSSNARKAATRSVRLASERLGWDSEARHAGAATDELELRERE